MNEGWRTVHIHCIHGVSPQCDASCVESGKSCWERLSDILTLKGFLSIVDPIRPDRKGWMKPFPHSLHSGILSCENPHMMSEKNSCQKRFTRILCIQSDFSWSGKYYLGQKQTWHKRLSHILCIHKASPQCESVVAAWALTCSWRPSHSGSSHMVLLSINPHELTEVCPLEKGTSTFVKPFPTFLPLAEILPCVDHGSFTWSMLSSVHEKHLLEDCSSKTPEWRLSSVLTPLCSELILRRKLSLWETVPGFFLQF